MKEFNLKLVFQAIDRATAPMRRIGEGLAQISRTSGLDKVASSTVAVGAGLGRVAQEAVRFGGLVATGAAAAGGAMFALVQRSAAAADALAKAADKLGVGIEPLQRLEYHAGLSGVATEQFRDSLRFLLNAAGETARGVGAAGETFARLGISVTDGSGKLKDAETLMFEVADAMAKIENPTLRVGIAQDLFGRSGASMINVLKDGAEAMREAGREAEQLGILTEDQVRASEEFNDNFDRLMKVIGHFSDMLAAELLPYMNDFVLWLRAAVIEMRPTVVEALTAAFVDVGQVVRWVVAQWQAMSASFGTWLTIAAAVSPTIAGIIARAVNFVRTFGLTETVVSLLATALGAKLLFAIVALFVPLAKLAWSLGVVAVRMAMLGAAGIKALVSGLVAILPALGSVIAATWAWTAALLANPLSWVVLGVVAAIAAIAGAAYLLYAHWDEVVAWFSEMWARVRALFDDARAAIAAAWEGFNPLRTIVEAVTAFVERLAGIDLSAVAGAWIRGLVDGIAAGWRSLGEWLDAAVPGLTAALGRIDWAAIGGGWVVGLVYGLVTRWDDVSAAIRRALPGVLEAIESLDLTGAGIAMVAALAAGVGARWDEFKGWLAEAAAGLGGLLPDAGFGDLGRAWVDQLFSGVAEGWRRLRAWLADQVEELLDILPDWVREKVGLDGLRAPAGGSAVDPAPAVSSALAPTKAQVGGTVRVAFENAPSGMRVKDVAADPGGVDIAVDAGYALAP